MLTLDHLFVLVAGWQGEHSDQQAAEEIAASLEDCGFVQSGHRRHAGQGTENRCFRFGAFMFELLFIVDRAEAGSEQTAPLGLLARRDNRSASPFGFASRAASGGERPGAVPASRAMDTVLAETSPEFPYPSVTYRPGYLPAGSGIPIASPVPIAEPLWFHLPSFMTRQGSSAQLPPHPNGCEHLAGVSWSSPGRPGALSQELAGALDIDMRSPAETHQLVLQFAGSKLAFDRLEPHPRLPVIFCS